jgi:hypothetical protein
MREFQIAVVLNMRSSQRLTHRTRSTVVTVKRTHAGVGVLHCWRAPLQTIRRVGGIGVVHNGTSTTLFALLRARKETTHLHGVEVTPGIADC